MRFKIIAAVMLKYDYIHNGEHSLLFIALLHNCQSGYTPHTVFTERFVGNAVNKGIIISLEEHNVHQKHTFAFYLFL